MASSLLIKRLSKRTKYVLRSYLRDGCMRVLRPHMAARLMRLGRQRLMRLRGAMRKEWGDMDLP